MQPDSALLAPTIQAHLSDRLIGELPRFFGGRLAAFRELFQNAYRAGAKHVTVTQDGPVLVVEDDGAGCPDPQLLLSAGETGWDEARVVEPAGLGFFSLLASDVASSVEAQSSGWRVTLMAAQVLAKKPIRVEQGSVQRGMRVQLILADANGVKGDIEEARAYYPFAVSFNGVDVPVTKWKPTWEIPTPVGLVGLRERGFHRRCTAIWEHRDIQGEAFAHALDAVDGALRRAIIGGFRIHWIVDPRSGVTPKLPDRNDLNPNAALQAAATIVLDAVADFLRKQAHLASQHWPPLIPADVKEPRWLFHTAAGKELLAELGWRPAVRTTWEDHNIWYSDGDGWQVETGGDETLTKDFIEVADGNVADSINCAVALGAKLPWAVVAPKGLTHRIVGHQKPRLNEAPWIGLCREIRVGAHRLPFLLDQSSESLTLACDADTAISAVLGHHVALPSLDAHVSDLLEGFLAASDNDQLSEGWADWDGEPSVDWQRIDRDLVEQVSNDYIGGQRAKARQRLHSIEAEQKHLAEARRNLTGVDDRPALTAVRTALKRLERVLAADHAAAAAKAKLPKLPGPAPTA